tara:strand:+ start:172 stop:489 length:318 start_codon:yes stop_codon:yes gene_type:complete
MKRNIKFIAQGKKWFDKINGNTYHSVQITRTKDNEKLFCCFQYGYGNQWQYTALEKMAFNKWIPKQYTGFKAINYDRDNNYPIEWIENYSTKKDTKLHGEVLKTI